MLFKSSAYSVLESTGVAKVSVIRYDGNMDAELRVNYTTVENTAVGGLDFEHTMVSSGRMHLFTCMRVQLHAVASVCMHSTPRRRTP